MTNRLQRILSAFHGRGGAGLYAEFAAFQGRRREARRYSRWLLRYGRLTEHERAAIRDEIAELEQLPLISIVLPVYDVDEKWLRLCIESVLKQIYSNWQLCIADDASPSPHIKTVLDEYASRDERIRTVFREVNGHISAASNSALELAAGEFTVLLDHDDELSEDALFQLAKTIVNDQDVQMIYSDEDVIDEAGRRFEPKFKPDFSRDLFYSLNLVTHLSAYRTSLLKEIGGFRLGMEGSQDYDLALRVIEKIDESQIRHIPRILYHWRAIATSVASSGEAKPYAYEKAREALARHFERIGTNADVVPASHNLNRIRYRLQNAPRVTLIAHGDGAASYDDSSGAVTELIQNVRRTPGALNAAANTSQADVICFVDARLRSADTEWLSELACLAMQPQIGAVGGKIMNSRGAIECVGFIVEGERVARVTDAKAGVYDAGYFFRAGLIGNFSAVSIACMAIRRDLFERLRGFDEGFGETLFDVDLCMRLWAEGHRIVYSPYAELIGSPTGLDDAQPDDRTYFKQKWAGQIMRDPFYNPNLSKTDLFSISD